MTLAWLTNRHLLAGAVGVRTSRPVQFADRSGPRTHAQGEGGHRGRTGDRPPGPWSVYVGRT